MGTCHSAGIVHSSSTEKATFQRKKKFKLTKKLNKTVPRIKKIFKKPEKLDKSTSFSSSFNNTVSIKDQYFEEEIEEIYENINIIDINNDLPHIKIDVKPNIVEIEEYDNSSSNNFSLIDDDTDTPSPFPLVIHPSIESTDIESIHIMTTMSSSRSAPNSQIPAVNRFGFKSTTTATNLSSATAASTTSNTAQINKTPTDPTFPAQTASTGIQIKRLNSNFTELSINTNEKNDINTNKSNEKIHNGSPPRSFLKPPNPVVLNQNSTVKNALKPTIPTLINRSPTSKQSNSSSLSSLSSTSSSLSITKLNENEPQKANTTTQVKKQLKYAAKPEAKPKMLAKSAKKSPEPNSKSNNENTKINTQPKQYEQMQEQEQQHNSIPIISNHKRILFKPYQLNINHNTNSNVNSSNSTNQSNKSNNVAMQKENTNETSNSNENTSQQQPQQKQFQSHLKQPLNLFTQLKGFKFGSNTTTNNNSESKLKFYSKTPIKATKNEETNKVTDNATSSNAFMSHNHSQLLGNASSIIKKEDSAYCSSTSSTVSSQDVDGGFSKEEKLNDFQMTMTKSTTNINSDSNNSNCEDDHLEVDSSKNKKDSLKVGSEMNTEEEFNQEDYIEDNYMMQNLKQTLISLDSSAAKQNEVEICNFESGKAKAKPKESPKVKSNIKESVGELNQLMIMSTSSLGSSLLTTSEEATQINLTKQRRTSSTSVSLNSSQVGASPMFKPPSTLPPIENGEVIQMDLETYRLLIDDIQTTKTILHKLVNLLRDPTGGCDFTYEPDDLQNLNTNPLISSFYSHVRLSFFLIELN